MTNAARKEAPRELSFEVGVQLQASNWFVRSCRPDRAYRADLALKGEDRRFLVIASSNPVQTPPSAPSSYADEQWLPIRMEPRQPESATPMLSPIDLALEPPSGAPSESGESPARLPIDMREEVRSKLAAVYGEQRREAPGSPLPGQLSTDEQWLPIRMEPRPPESATPVLSPINLALAPPSGAPSELGESPVRLPIDMREEVRSMLAVLYGERERDIAEPPLPSPSPLPIDMREEVNELFPRLYPGLEAEPPAPIGSPQFMEKFMEKTPMEKTPIDRVFLEFRAVFPETKPSAIADLTELNERSFTSGISSRTK